MKHRLQLFTKASATVLFVFCAALATSSSSNATETVTFDGVWWTGLTDSEQIIAVQAMLGGYQQGYNNGFIYAVSKDTYLYHSTRSNDQALRDPDSHTFF